MGLHCDVQHFVSVSSENELREALLWARERDLSVTVIGGGSNVIVASVLMGLVIHMDIKGLEFNGLNVTAAAGESWQNLVDSSIAHALFGLENLTLIPGTVGAAPIQNIGAYGVELADFFVSLKAMNIVTGQIETFSREQCGFGYRQSTFKQERKGSYVIVSVTLALESKFEARLTYPDLATRFGTKRCNAREIADAVNEIRLRKLPDPSKIGNTGSFFKNPELTQAQYDKIASRIGDVSVHRTRDGLLKISAAALIEKAGLKGYSLDGAGVSTMHALVIVNLGGAESDHVINLSKEIMTVIESRFDIKLEIEPVKLGFTRHQ